ncbi:Eukaryotic translation initiation factor isoform 4G-1 [Cardamine amara subsp. amara]|uniref:Eukaryotic translation initiation factor isoform 4G-1 n=1 Tax=Cardamine amara subsp. amara TaxID=228776 RepID=A0ABD1B742_CARAN
MVEKNNMRNAKLVCFRSSVLLQDWITFRALALENRSWLTNQIVQEKYGHLLNQLINSCTTVDILKDVVALIFDKAVLEPTFCPMYAQLCYDIHDKLPTFEDPEPLGCKILFKKVLLNTCQIVFEGADELSEEIRKMNAPDQKAERTDKEILLNLRTLGNLRLIGELFSRRMVTNSIVDRIVEKLLSDAEELCPSEEKLEAVCLFLQTVSNNPDWVESKEKHLKAKYFRRLKILSNHPQLIMRTRVMIRNVINLR